MTQYARPASDISAGSWTYNGGPSSLWDCLNEVTPSDSDYCEEAGGTTTMEVKFDAGLDDPLLGTGHIVRWRWNSTGSGAKEKMTVELYEATTLRATCVSEEDVDRAWTTKNYTLSAGEANAISDYTDLRIRLTVTQQGGSEECQVSWAELEVPDLAGPVGEVFRVDLEEGNFDDFDSTTGVEDLAVNGAAAMVGSYGMEVTINDINDHFGQNDFTISTDEIRWRFYLDPNNMTFGDGDEFIPIVLGSDGTYNSITSIIWIWFGWTVASGYSVWTRFGDDADVSNDTDLEYISDDVHYIEIYMKRETYDGGQDGIGQMWVDGVEVSGGESALENYNVFPTIDKLVSGSVANQDAATTGSFYIDDIILRDDDTLIGPADGGNFQDVAGVLTAVGILSKETSKTFTGSSTFVGTLIKQAQKLFTGATTPVGTLATSFLQLISIAGSLTPSGTLIKQTGKKITGSLTASGELIKSTIKSFTGSLTAAGTLIKQPGKILLGSITLTGILATAKTASLSIGGSLIPSGSLIKQTKKIFTGATTAAGILVKQTRKIFTGNLTPVGTLIKQTTKAFIGAITAVGSLATQKISGGYFQVVGGALTMSGIVVKQANKLFIGSITTVGTLVKQTRKILLGSTTFSGVLTTAKTTLLSIGGSLTPVGTLVRQTSKILVGNLTPVGMLVRQTAKAFGGSVTAVGSLIKQAAISLIGSITAVGSLATQKIVSGYFQVVGGILTMSGIVTRQTNKIFTGSVTAVGVLVKRTAKAFTSSIIAVGTLAKLKSSFKIIGGVLTMSGVLVRQTNKQIAGIVTMTGSITKRISKSIGGVLTAVGVLVRQLLGLPTPYDQTFAIASENRIYAIASENRIYSVPG